MVFLSGYPRDAACARTLFSVDTGVILTLLETSMQFHRSDCALSRTPTKMAKPTASEGWTSYKYQWDRSLPLGGQSKAIKCFTDFLRCSSVMIMFSFGSLASPR